MPSVYRTKDRNGIPHLNWRIRYMDWQGVRQSCVGLPSKSDTLKLAWKIQTEHDEIRKGLRPPPQESEKPRLFREVADEYLEWGKSQGGHGGRPWSDKHSELKILRLRFWEERLELKMLSDLIGSLSRVERVLRELQLAGPKGKPCVGKTLQNYAETIASFCDWAIDRDYLTEDPLKKLQSFNTASSWQRRAITIEEAKAILGVAAPHRRLIYSIAMITGLRAGELRLLRVGDFQEGLVLRPEITKNRKEGFQPLSQVLIDELSVATKGRDLNELLLSMPKNASEMLYRDMKKVGIAIWTADGKLDFHALRTSFATFVIETGANVKETQSLMRHSTPDLTMRIYARAREHPLQGVVSSVGERLLGPCQTSGKQEATLETEVPANTAINAASAAAVPLSGEGSIPSTSIGQIAAIDGQNQSQVGQDERVARSIPVDFGTQVDAAKSALGQPECQTNGKRLPDDLQRLAVVWNQLPTEVRRSIEAIAFNTGKECSGFSGYRQSHSDSTQPISFSGFSGFSGLSNAAA